MASICGILGKSDPAVVDTMARALAHRGDAEHRANGKAYSIASSSPVPRPPCLVDGSPRDTENQLLDAKALRKRCREARGPDKVVLRDAFAAAVSMGRGLGWWLVRDRLGRRPLYYFQGPDYLLFASELKALLATGLVRKRLNLAAVDRYLTMRCVPGAESIVRGVYRVEPGHVVEYRGGAVNATRFSSFTSASNDVPREVAAAQVRRLLESALEQEPCGSALWSSGIDSAAMGALKPGLGPVWVGLARAWQRNARAARESARKLGLELDTVSAKRLTEDLFKRVVRALDEPVADASVFPLYLVLEAAGRRSSEFLSGHGADTILAGYPRYHFLDRAKGAQALVPSTLVGNILPALPPNAFVRRSGRYLASLDDSLGAFLSLVSVFDQEEREELYTDAMKSALADKDGFVPLIRERFGHPDLSHNVQSLDLAMGLPDLLLAQCDRLAAANGVTLRLPYLADELVDYMTGLSPKTKFGVRSKPLLRMALKGVVPGATRLRARRGFQIPRTGSVARVIETVTRHVITPERVDATGIFKWQVVDRVVRSAGHNVYRRRQFWALLMFFTWFEQVMED